MTRISKKAERKSRSPRKHRFAAEKTGSRKDNLTKGFREHPNALESEQKQTIYIAKVR
ncbi:MAG: hypothetical protein KDK78_06160 [Chlamydiia bacterium]|nr:hypothetical protein [Chlamydiia bacterium]